MFSILLLGLTMTIPTLEQFKDYHEEEGVKVRILRTQPHPWISGTTEIDAPVEEIAKILSEVGEYKNLFEDMIEESKVLSKKENVLRVHLVWPFPIFMSDRDAVVTYESSKDPKTGKFTLQWKKTSEEGDPSEGVRIENVEGRTEVTPIDDKKSQVVYTYIGDLGKDFGESISETAWKHEPVKYFEALKKALKKNK